MKRHPGKMVGLALLAVGGLGGECSAGFGPGFARGSGAPATASRGGMLGQAIRIAPRIPGVPGIPGMQIKGMPRIPGMPGLPGVGSLPGLIGKLR